MPVFRAAEFLPLTGADGFLRMLELETRHRHGASHLSQFRLRLGRGFDRKLFEERFASLAGSAPIVCSSVGRRFGVGRPVYRRDRRGRQPRLAASRAPGSSDPSAPSLPDVFDARLNGLHDLSRGELLRADLVEYDSGPLACDLALTWSHLLMDGFGVERLLEELDAGRIPTDRGAPDASRERPPLFQRIRLARQWALEMMERGHLPIRSPAGALPSGPQQIACDVIELDASASASVARREERFGEYLQPMVFHLAAAIRAHHAVLAERGTVPESYALPVAVNLRRRGRRDPVFRCHVAPLWFQVASRDVANLGTLVERLREQRLDALRGGAVERSIAAQDLMLNLPWRRHSRLARATFRGELASFFFASTGELLPHLERFFGAPVVSAHHVAAVPPSPGSAVVVSRRAACFILSHVYQQTAFTPEERTLLRQSLLRDLAGEAA